MEPCPQREQQLRFSLDRGETWCTVCRVDTAYLSIAELLPSTDLGALLVAVGEVTGGYYAQHTPVEMICEGVFVQYRKPLGWSLYPQVRARQPVRPAEATPRHFAWVEMCTTRHSAVSNMYFFPDHAPVTFSPSDFMKRRGATRLLRVYRVFPESIAAAMHLDGRLCNALSWMEIEEWCTGPSINKEAVAVEGDFNRADGHTPETVVYTKGFMSYTL